jgi:nitrogen-specific signal transduction histidine kinase/CheY-like chemotaxis protein
MVFIVRDITDRKRAEADRAILESQNRQLQKAESLGRMAGAIAHHFNNQLQSVMANLELLGGLPNATDPTKYLARAKQATQRAAAVSMQMLAYLGQTPGEREPRFLSELCRDSLVLLQDNQSGNLSLETDFPSPGPVISANADQIHQILTNLVANAGEAMGDGRGRIRLQLSTCSAVEIPSRHRFPIDWQPQGLDHACLEVADPGCGIAEADIEKLFDPFFSTKFTGRGLGLPVVLGIVQAHGGAVTVDSRPGQGSVFRVYFPVSAETMPTLPEAGVPASQPEGGGTILLVDDDESLLQSTGALIEMMGFAVLTARDGVEAVEVFRQRQGDIRCVITDLTMPRMDGWETLTALRQLEPTLPVILASGYDKAEVMSRAQADRPQAFLGKPFGLQQLRDTVGLALADKRKL